MGRPERQIGAYTQRLGQRHTVFQKTEPLVHPAEHDAGQPEQGRGQRPPDIEVLLPARVQALLKQRQGSIELTAAKPDESGKRSSDRVREGMSARRGRTLRMIQVRGGGVELAQFGERERQPPAGGDEGDSRLWPFRLTPCALERLHVLLEDGLGLPVVPLRMVAVAEIAARERLKRGIVDAVTDPQASFTVLAGQLRLALEVVIVDEIRVDTSQPLIVPQLLRHPLSLTR